MTDRLQEIRERHDAIGRGAQGGGASVMHCAAEFIAHSPEDIGYLLRRLAAAEELIEATQSLAMCENRGQQLQATVDARLAAAAAATRWEDAR